MGLMERFMAKVSPEPNSGCWLWTAHVDQGGYSRIAVNGKAVSGHRTSYEMFVGPIPDGLELDHLCRIRSCVNPDHLEPVTRQTNVLRGDARFAGAHERAKTHCPLGHPYSGANLQTISGSRRCKTCKSLHHKNWRERRNEKRSAIECRS